MLRQIETMGTALLGLFVPKVDAGACGTWGWKYFANGCQGCDAYVGGIYCQEACWGWCASGCGCDQSKNRCDWGARCRP